MRRIYRDTKTGKFVSKEKYERSKARGGTRYRAQRVAEKSGKLPKPETKIPPPEGSRSVGSHPGRGNRGRADFEPWAGEFKTPKTIEEWEAMHDEAEDFYEEEEYEGSADY